LSSCPLESGRLLHANAAAASSLAVQQCVHGFHQDMLWLQTAQLLGPFIMTGQLPSTAGLFPSGHSLSHDVRAGLQGCMHAQPYAARSMSGSVSGCAWMPIKSIVWLVWCPGCSTEVLWRQPCCSLCTCMHAHEVVASMFMRRRHVLQV
jgi:hypothetical protein